MLLKTTTQIKDIDRFYEYLTKLTIFIHFRLDCAMLCGKGMTMLPSSSYALLHS